MAASACPLMDQALAVSCSAKPPVSVPHRRSGHLAVLPLPTSASFFSLSASTRQNANVLQQKRRFPVFVKAEEGATQSDEPPPPPKPTLAKNTIVSVDKEKYLASVEFKAVDHPAYFKGLDYIYEARGEVLEARIFDSGEYALVSWAGIPTAPAWLPAYMLKKEKPLAYTRT